MLKEKTYKVPANIMGQILELINNLPYGQVAPLANSLGALIKEQNTEEEETNGNGSEER